MMTSYTLALKPVLDLTGEQFFQLCRGNPDLKFERKVIPELELDLDIV